MSEGQGLYELSKEFNECPNCKGRNFLYKAVANKLIAEGTAEKDFKAFLQAMQSPIVDKRHKPIIGDNVPVVELMTDVCLDCGTVFARSIKIQKATIKPNITIAKGNLPPTSSKNN